MIRRESLSAANRFGLGARPGDLAGMGEPRAWLAAQLQSPPLAPALQGLPDSLAYLRREADYQRERRQARQQATGDPQQAAQQAQQAARGLYRQAQAQELAARYRVAVSSPAGFAERLVQFWSNHFAVSLDKRAAALYAAPMEREAIRPHCMGHFADLLLAVERHPAMLRYLDNANSVGPDSLLAQRAQRRALRLDPERPVRRLGLNENLAREILELHTLGVDGGYTQADVTELARAITGWGVPAPRDFEQGAPGAAFVFRAPAHAAGSRLVLGRRYAEDGVAQGEAILAALARHPATAQHVSFKLARHFVRDDPPPALVQRMADAWRRNDGDLRHVYRALIDSPEAWDAQARKFKPPQDFVVSALRAGGAWPEAPPQQKTVLTLLARMGQPPFTPRSPAGYADVAAEWSGADALWKRVQAAEALAGMAPGEPLALAATAFGDGPDADTLTAVRRAESPREGVAVLLASPAFQWRA
ncbi:DUF1800 domain-containing protein [uncultured Xanthomonas sp.]|uniref:DUF1800 domain-containing protein n=1 Tax=uncultured Xanthomonas sp. TaxID=152831 RepID=UPI0025D7317C|nr:DUF1800 domain-containing protein [uncultured Xanthomonas sp.]